MDTLASRIARIETELGRSQRAARRWRIAALSLAAPLAALVLGAAMQAGDIPEVLRARRLEIVDSQDRVIMLASHDGVGGRVDLWNDTGANTVRLGSTADGGDIVVFHSSLVPVCGISATPAGGRVESLCAVGGGGAAIDSGDAGSRVSISDSGGNLAVNLSNAAAGGLLETRTSSGVLAAAIGAGSGAGGFVQVSNGQGAQVFAAHSRQDGTGKLSLAGAKGEPNFVAETGAENGGTLSMFACGHRVVGLGAGSDGGLLNLATMNGNNVLAAGAASDADGGLIWLRSGAGRTLVRAGVGADGAGQVTVFDGPGSRKLVLSPIEPSK